MQTGRFFSWAVLAGATLLAGIVPLTPVRAQDSVPVFGKISINGPNGVQEKVVDLSQFPPGDDGFISIMGVGPDGQVFSYGGRRDSQGTFVTFGTVNSSGAPGAIGGLDIVDPGRSYIYQLIKRNDVRSELFLTAKQREALEGAEVQQQQQTRQTLQEMGAALQGKSREELKTLTAEQAKQIQEQMRRFTEDQDKKLASILPPKQMKRLKELDLQWRGSLAMGVKPVADQVNLTNEQTPKAAALLQEYRQGIARQLSFGLQPAAFNPKPGAGAPAYGTTTTPAEMQAKMETAKKEIEKTRKALEEKVLKELTGDQRAQWSSLTGKPFRFRTND